MKHVLNRLTAIYFFLLIAISFSTTSSADFALAMKYYEQKDFQKAYHEFLEAAEYGDYSSQYNIGAMYYRGEFVEKNLIEAYAWFFLSAQDPNSRTRQVHTSIYKKLSPEEKQKAEKRYEEINAEYGDDAIEKKLTPVFLGGTPLLKKFRLIKTVAPDYPMQMAQRGSFGWVDMLFTIEKDGTTKDHVVYSSPHQAFTDAAIKSARQSLFEPLKINGKPVTVTGVKRRYIFEMAGTSFNKKRITAAMQEMKEKAIKGDDSDKLGYAYFLDSIPSFAQIDDIKDNPNKWYMEAANSGNAAASFFLGQNILYGNMCTADSSISMGWLIKAATNNITDAQYTLAIELMSGARFERNEEKALYWLQRAAASSTAAQLRYAWILTTHPSAEKRDGALAKTYLDMVDKGYHDKQTLFQVAAAVAAENNDFKAAIDWQTKALKDARGLELPLDYVNQRLAAYNNKQPWREAL